MLENEIDREREKEKEKEKESQQVPIARKSNRLSESASFGRAEQEWSCQVVVVVALVAVLERQNGQRRKPASVASNRIGSVVMMANG